MMMDVLAAILMSFLPIALLTFSIAYFSFNNGIIDINDEKRGKWDLVGAKRKKRAKGEARPTNNYLHEKWVKFGGGFYGLMALVTFFVIELRETIGFLGSIQGWHSLTNLLSLHSLIELLVASFMNFVTAMIWFTYWPDNIEMDNGWIWLGMAFGGYHFGRKVAELRLN